MGTASSGPRSVDLLSRAFISDTLPGRVPGEGYGLGVRHEGEIIAPAGYRVELADQTVNLPSTLPAEAGSRRHRPEPKV
jgi:hypothetical protein